MKIQVVSPMGFVMAAGSITCAFALLHIAGLRESTTILSGTAPPGGGSSGLGILYVVMYFAFVVIAPILAIAAVVMALFMRYFRRRGVEAQRN